MPTTVYTLHGDAPDVTPGSLLASARSWFRVLAVRKVKTRDGARRFSLMYERIAEPDVVDAPLYSIQWNRRTRKKARRCG